MSRTISRANINASARLCNLQPSDAILESDARTLNVLPVSVDAARNELTVAVNALDSPMLKDKVSQALLSDFRVHWEVRSLKEIAIGLDAAYGKKSAVMVQLKQLATDVSECSVKTDFAIDSVVVDLVHAVFEDASILSASDIHLSPDLNQIRVRFRVDGVLVSSPSIPLEFYARILVRLKVLAKLDIAECRLPQDGHLSLSVFGEELDCRISTFPIHGGENTVIRVLDGNKSWQSLDRLIPSCAQRRLIMQSLNQPQGLVVVCGPTGSGKTTTLYSMLKTRENDSNSVMTLEDPIEFPLPRVKQSALGVTSKMSMSDAVRGLLRQDPDILLVGEIRDPDTCRHCIRASLSGRLLLTSIHAADCLFALQRLSELCGDRGLVAASLTAVVSQRLLRVVCRSCGGSGHHCIECSGSGFGSRRGLFEILTLNSEMRELIRRDAPYEVMFEAASSTGFIPLRVAAMKLVRTGIVSEFEIERVIGPELS